MPEAPDLEVIKEVLDRRRVKGLVIQEARVLKPLELRVLTPDGIAEDAAGRSFLDFSRRGKFLLMRLSGERMLVINPMLTGALRLCNPSERLAKRTSFVLSLSDGCELRYLDETQMGMAYYIESSQMGEIPRLGEQGPDVLGQYPSLDGVQGRPAPLPRARSRAYSPAASSWRASGTPTRTRRSSRRASSLSRSARPSRRTTWARLHEAIPRVLHEAIDVLRERMAEDIHLKVRDFLQVHGKGGSPCPRCGGNITTIGANQRLTNYCRRCQPGMLLRN